MITLDGKSLSLKNLIRIARDFEEISLSDASQVKINQASSFVDSLVKKGTPIYGINTGFGDLANVSIKHEELEKLQVNLLKSHACGMKDPLPIETATRA